MLKEKRKWDDRPKLADHCRTEETEMLKGHSIVYFGPSKWDGMWRNRQQLMSRFAQCNRVMYVEPVVYLKSLRHQLRQGYFNKVGFWKTLLKRRVRRVSTNLYIYKSPVFIPIAGRFPLDKITWWAWKLLLKSAMRRLGFQRPIIWLSLPHMEHFVRSFNEKLSIYHVVDEYSAYGGNNIENKIRLEPLEKQMLEKADMVIVVSNKLFKTKGLFNKHTYVVPNAVDFSAYDRALISSNTLPSDIARLPKPVIGYSGLISRRLDLDLIYYIASAHPEWSLAMIGAIDERWCEDRLARLKQTNNVHFLGLKEIELVPYYVKAFDVCFIPYVIDEETENLSPLKLYDFMASGKPIVTTAFPSAQEFKNIVYIAESKRAFTCCIEEALLESDNSLFNARRHTASLNTWDHRVNQLSCLIESRLLRS